MIVSTEWLKQFVDVRESPAELADLLSGIGLDAEFTGIQDNIKGVVIGRVKTAEKHPNADKLSLCTVSDGKNEFQVVCGAPNVAEGQTIAYASVGAILAGNVKIKKVKIRGTESCGMICSERELGISDEHEGILVLPEHLQTGDDFLEACGQQFMTLELDITPNRPDAFSHIGVARDIAVKTGRKLRFPDMSIAKSTGEKALSITMENNKDCPRYIGGIVSQVSPGSSPEWMRARLEAAGQRSISNLVDISNYVLLEMGHPTHIFDFDKLEQKAIHVRRATKGETLTTLDENRHELGPEHLLITDGKSPVALAGVMGGLESAVTNDTSIVLVESAYFDPVTIRKGSKSLGISTEASKRFERGADYEGTVKAFWRVIELLEELTGGKMISDMVDACPLKLTSPEITLRRSELNLIMGVVVDETQVEAILNGLGFHIKSTVDGWSCIPPTFRPDVEREIDIIEEIARIYGFDEIPTDESIYGEYRHDIPDPESWLQAIRNTMAGFGFHQLYSNSLQNQLASKLTGLDPVPMMNPLNQEMAFLRTSLLPGLMKAADHNIKNGTTDLRLFELGNVHEQQGKDLAGITEKLHMAGLVFGREVYESVHHEDVAQDFYSLKGYVIGLLNNKLHLNAGLKSADYPGFDHSHQILVDGETVGAMGRISSNWIKKMRLDLETTYGFEFDMNLLADKVDHQRQYVPVNLFPKVHRRLNFVMPESQAVGPMSDMMVKQGEGLLNDAEPINIFTDEKQVNAGFKSITFNLEFHSAKKTLEDKDVTPIIDEIIRIAEKKFHAKLRS